MSLATPQDNRCTPFPPSSCMKGDQLTPMTTVPLLVLGRGTTARPPDRPVSPCGTGNLVSPCYTAGDCGRFPLPTSDAVGTEHGLVGSRTSPSKRAQP